MVYLSVIVVFLAVYIFVLHRKLRDVSDLLKESALLSTVTNSSKQNDYYLKFSIDKDFKIIDVNNDLLKYAKFKTDDLVGKRVLGTILEDVDGNEKFLLECKKKFKHKKTTFSCEQTILRADGRRIPILLRVRPLLNDRLSLSGISFWGYPLNQRIKLEKQLQDLRQKDQITGDIYNAETFIKNLDNRVRSATNYGRNLTLIVIETADVYNFINRGFSFNTGDKLIRLVADACVECCGNKALIGRFDTTKIGLILEDEYSTAEKIKETTEILWDKMISNIRKLKVDTANAGMVCIFYTRMHRFCDSSDNMLSRSRVYLKNSLFCHNYGIATIDRN